MKPSPPAIEHPMCHDHSLVFLKKREVEVPCEACKESIDGPSYSCLECIHVYFHLDCVHLSKEMYHPCHPLEVAEESEKSCYFCAAQPKVLYHCSICNFSVCFGCTKHPPPLVVEDPKTHKHLYTFLGTGCHRVLVWWWFNSGWSRRPVSQYYGAYVCSVCPDYTVHSYCAVNIDVWNGVELEGIPEKSEDIAPFTGGGT
ncbi:unnamed protein product [Brassica oleracea]